MEVHELEPADLESPIDFEKLYRSNGGRRRPQSVEAFGPDEVTFCVTLILTEFQLDNLQYADNDEDFPFYARKKHHNQQYRFGFRRKRNSLEGLIFISR
jgi:hypothetical protein